MSVKIKMYKVPLGKKIAHKYLAEQPRCPQEMQSGAISIQVKSSMGASLGCLVAQTLYPLISFFMANSKLNAIGVRTDFVLILNSNFCKKNCPVTTTIQKISTECSHL